MLENKLLSLNLAEQFLATLQSCIHMPGYPSIIGPAFLNTDLVFWEDLGQQQLGGHVRPLRWRIQLLGLLKQFPTRWRYLEQLLPEDPPELSEKLVGVMEPTIWQAHTEHTKNTSVGTASSLVPLPVPGEQNR